MKQTVANLVEADKGQVIRKAKKNELEFGLRPDFKKIGQYRNDDYAFIKNLQNPLAGYGNIDLIRTGAFVNSLFPVRRGNGFIFDSNVDYRDNLIENHGEAPIVGLNQKTFNKIQIDVLAPELRKEIKQILGQ